MSRTRDWLKFGTLVALAAVLAVGFLAVLDWPERSVAQQPAAAVALTGRPAPVIPAKPAEDFSNVFVAVAEAVRPAVVYIVSESRSGRAERRRPDVPPPFDRFFPDAPDLQPQPQRGQGSGFLISPDGYVMTNNHVVEGFDRLEVTLLDGRHFSATVVGRDPNTDVAVIKIDGKNLPAAAFGDSDSLRIGEWVLAIGNPFGQAFSFTVTAGIVSGRGRALGGLQRGDWDIQDFIQTDAAINPGNSGGPLVNIRGQVVGVNSAIASQTGTYTGYSFAIPIKLARTVADQLIREGKVTRAALGIRIRPVDPEDAAYVGLKDIRGVMVTDFADDNSPAKRAGLQPGDVIVEVDGHRIDYVAQLQQIVGFKRPGERIRVTVQRQGGVRDSYTVRLTEAATEPSQVARGGTGEREESAPYETKLGVSVEPLTARDASGDPRIGADNRGLLITRVDPDGPARDKGLFPASPQQGVLDIITHVNGQRVQTLEELRGALATVRSGEIVSLRVLQVRRDASVRSVVRIRAGGS